MSDQFFKTLTVGVRFNKQQLTSLKRKSGANDEENEEVETDFFASKKSADPEASTKKPKIKSSAAKKESFRNSEEINIFRKENDIKVYGSDIPAPVRSFDAMLKYGVPETVLQAVKSAGLKKPTPVQKQAVTLLSQVSCLFKIYLYNYFAILESGCLRCGSHRVRKDFGFPAWCPGKIIQIRGGRED